MQMETQGSESSYGSSPSTGGIDWNFIVNRVKNILFSPKETWTVIKNEPSSIKDIYLKYFLIVAAVPAIAMALGQILFGFQFMTIKVDVPFGQALGFGVMQYIGMVLTSYLFAFILEKIANNMGGSASTVSALKLVVYSLTAGAVGGIFHLVPGLWPISMVASLYGLYLFWTGVPELTGVPDNNRIKYVIVSFIVCLVASFILGLILAIFTPRPQMPDLSKNYQQTVDLEKLEKGMKVMDNLFPGSK